jgi:hypothetical protein
VSGRQGQPEPGFGCYCWRLGTLGPQGPLSVLSAPLSATHLSTLLSPACHILHTLVSLVKPLISFIALSAPLQPKVYSCRLASFSQEPAVVWLLPLEHAASWVRRIRHDGCLHQWVYGSLGHLVAFSDHGNFAAIYLIAGMVCGLLALYIERPIIIGTTSFVGSFFFCAGKATSLSQSLVASLAFSPSRCRLFSALQLPASGSCVGARRHCALEARASAATTL